MDGVPSVIRFDGRSAAEPLSLCLSAGPVAPAGPGSARHGPMVVLRGVRLLMSEVPLSSRRGTPVTHLQKPQPLTPSPDQLDLSLLLEPTALDTAENLKAFVARMREVHPTTSSPYALHPTRQP